MLNLNIIDLYHMCRTSNLTHSICNDPFFWQEKNLIDGVTNIDLNNIIYLAKETIQLLDDNRYLDFRWEKSHIDQQLHQLITDDVIFYPQITYTSIQIIDNQLIYTIDSDTYSTLYRKKVSLSKHKLFELFLYLFYFNEDFRYYADPKNYKKRGRDIVFTPKNGIGDFNIYNIC